MTASHLPAIILAAGESTRMGEPKALVNFGKHSFLQTIRNNLTKSGIEHIVTVLGYAANEIIRKLNLQEDDFIIHKNYRLGQFSSFQAGVKQLPPKTKGVFLCLVDQPQIQSEVFCRLRETFQMYPEKIIIPAFQGKRGHPTVFPGSLFSEIIAAPANSTAKEIIDSHRGIVFEMNIPDKSILWNLNTKKDLQDALDQSEANL